MVNSRAVAVDYRRAYSIAKYRAKFRNKLAWKAFPDTTEITEIETHHFHVYFREITRNIGKFQSKRKTL